MSRWGVLELEVPRELEEAALALWAGESLGAETVGAPPGRCRLSVYFATPEAAASALGPTLAWLERQEARGRPLSARARPVGDGRWVERYLESLEPFPLGRSFLVVPREMPAELAGREPIRLVPGRAFGTGEHPTTCLAVESLEDHVKPGSRWLDVGTGSGILAVVALRRGAGCLAACDTDPEALEVARETHVANGLGERVLLRPGSADLFAGEGFDGTVANISTGYLLERASDLAAALRPGGILLATGFLSGDEVLVERALAASGLFTEERRGREGWSLLVARHPWR